jgi:hypothetical protein
MMQKMKVTDAGCRFMLQLPRLALVRLSVTQEERAALSRFLADLKVRNGSCSVWMDNCKEFITDEYFTNCAGDLDLDYAEWDGKTRQWW